MFVSIIKCKEESINGEVIFMLMTKIWLFIPFSVLKLKKFEISSNFALGCDFADFWKERQHLQ